MVGSAVLKCSLHMEDHKDVPHEKGGAACLRDAGVLLGAVSRNRDMKTSSGQCQHFETDRSARIWIVPKRHISSLRDSSTGFHVRRPTAIRAAANKVARSAQDPRHESRIAFCQIDPEIPAMCSLLYYEKWGHAVRSNGVSAPPPIQQ